jgi:hypothetical protein
MSDSCCAPGIDCRGGTASATTVTANDAAAGQLPSDYSQWVNTAAVGAQGTCIALWNGSFGESVRNLMCIVGARLQ